MLNSGAQVYRALNSGSRQAQLVDPQQTQWPAPQQNQHPPSQQSTWHVQQQAELQVRKEVEALFQSFSEAAKIAVKEQIAEAVEAERRSPQSVPQVYPRYGSVAGDIQGWVSSHTRRPQNVQRSASPLTADPHNQHARCPSLSTGPIRNASPTSRSAARSSPVRSPAKHTAHASMHKLDAFKSDGLAVRKGKVYWVCSECGLFYNNSTGRNEHEKKCTPESRARANAMLEYFCEIVEGGEECGYVTHKRGCMWNHQNMVHGDGKGDYTLK